MESLFAILDLRPRRRRFRPGENGEYASLPVAGEGAKPIRLRGRLASDLPGQLFFEFMAAAPGGLSISEIQEMEIKDSATPLPQNANPDEPFVPQPIPGSGRQTRTFGFPSTKGLIQETAGTYESVRKVKVMQLIAAIVAGLAAGFLLVAVVMRISHPIALTGRGWAGVAAAISALGFSASLVCLHVLMPKAQGAKTLPQAIDAYCRSCIAAVACNAAALVFVAVAALADGLSGGLWIPLAAVSMLNVIGLVLGWPKISVLRTLHYSPSLPYVR